MHASLLFEVNGIVFLLNMSLQLCLFTTVVFIAKQVWGPNLVEAIDALNQNEIKAKSVSRPQIDLSKCFDASTDLNISF